MSGGKRSKRGGKLASLAGCRIDRPWTGGPEGKDVQITIVSPGGGYIGHMTFRKSEVTREVMNQARYALMAAVQLADEERLITNLKKKKRG